MDLLDDYSEMIVPLSADALVGEDILDLSLETNDSSGKTPFVCPNCGSTELHVNIYQSVREEFSVLSDGSLGVCLDTEDGETTEVLVECLDCNESFAASLTMDSATGICSVTLLSSYSQPGSYTPF